MATTTRGYEYPASTGHTRIWEHIQALAEDVDTDVGELAGPPIAVLRQTVAQTGIANGTWTALTFTTEDLDTHAGHSTSSNTSRYVCQRAGKYRLTGAAAWATEATGTFWTRWAKNGTEIDGSGVNMVTTTSQSLVAARSIIVSLALTDYVELQSAQFSGGTGDTYVGVGYAQSTMCVEWISE